MRTIGNHDFCHSLENIVDYTVDPSALVVVSNIRPVAGSASAKSWGAVGFGIKQVGELKVGFFGLVSRPWDELQTQPEHLRFYAPDLECDFEFTTVACNLIAAHKDEVDLMVHVSHLGLRGDLALCEEVDGIDIVLGGHSHTVLDEVRVVNGAAIIHCGAEGQFVGQLDLEVAVGGQGGYTVLDYDLKLTQEQLPHPPTEQKIQTLVAARAPGWDSALFTARSDATIEVVQEFAAAALLRQPLTTASGELCYADVVLLDDALAKLQKPSNLAWSAGDPISPQTLLEVYPIEIQLAGTEGTSSFFSAELSPLGAQRLLDMVVTHGSLRDGNSLADYITHLNATGDFGVIPQKKRAWRFATLAGGETLVVHGGSTAEVQVRAANAVEKLAAAAAGSPGGVVRVLLPKPAALHPSECGLLPADDVNGMGILGTPTFAVEAWEVMAALGEKFPEGDAVEALAARL